MLKSRSASRPKPSKTKLLRARPQVAKAKARSSARAKQLVDALLREMQEGVRDPSYRESEAWEKLFGSKDSLVMNLQKLVSTLAALPEDETKEADDKQPEPITPEEMVLLKAWIEDTKPSG